MQKTLLQIAKKIITEGCMRNPTYSSLTDYQRDNLAAAAVKELDTYTHEAIDETIITKEFNEKLIEALQEQHVKDKAVLCKELGEMLLKGAIEYCKKPINDCLDHAVTELAITRQFYDESCIDAQNFIAEDNVQRAQDMNQAARGR